MLFARKMKPLCMRVFCLIFWGLLQLSVAGCGGGGSSSTQQPESPVDNLGTDVLVDNGDEDDELRPIVNAGLDQTADANVVISISGSAEAQGEATIQAIEWTQLAGKVVTIPNPSSFSNIIPVPDTRIPERLVFALTVTDTEGRINRDVSIVNVIPLQTFIRVISSSVDESAGTTAFRIELSQPSENDTFVTYETLDGSAEEGSDYIAVQGEVVIPAGDLFTEIEVELIDDGIQEGDETLQLYITGDNVETQNAGLGTLLIRNGNDTIELIAQVIQFEEIGPVDANVNSVFVNAIVDNPEEAPGTGELTYRSSNPLTAAVNPETGEVTTFAQGTVVISAFKESDSTYAAAQASYTLNVLLLEQQLVFEQAGPFDGAVGDSFTNTLSETGEGIGQITFSSSNPEIAEVDTETGEVTLLSGGSVTITATKAADATYAEVTASYSINVDLTPQTISFELAGPLSSPPGGSIVNTLVDQGSGTGAINYSSSNSEVVSVDAVTGEVELLAIGSATITAIKAADSEFAQAEASYTINVALMEQNISFVNNSLEGSIGETLTNPLNDQGSGTGSITYSSSDENIATVNSTTGQVTLQSAGSATITATKAADSEYAQAEASYTISVALMEQSISFVNNSLEGSIGETLTNPLADQGAGTGTITYSSSDEDIATVDATSGEVTLQSAGSATITATKAADAQYAQAEASYTVSSSLIPQTIAFASPTSQVDFGESFVKTLSETGEGTGTVTYSSSNSSVASVNATTGGVTARGVGTAIIVATKEADAVYAEAEASYTVTVNPAPQVVEFQDSSPSSIAIDDTYTNQVLVEGGNGAITFSSSNPGVATVSSSGQVTGISAGTVTITATKAASEGYLQASDSYSITITLKPDAIAFGDPGPFTKGVEESFTNSITNTGEGSGAITYVSSNPSIVRVDDDTTGAITALAPGVVTITARKDSDGVYQTATASYQITVVNPQ